MRKRDLVKMIIAIIIIAIISIASTSNTELVDKAKALFATKATTTVVVTPTATQQVVVATATPVVAAPTVAPTVESANYADLQLDGGIKRYFCSANDAVSSGLQSRIDLAVISGLKVYDIVREGDVVVVDKDGNEVNVIYGIELLPESVTFQRNSFKLLTWDEDLEVNKDFEGTLKGAADSKFEAKVFCPEHKAIKATEHVAYVVAESTEGDFVVDLLGNDIFDSMVLVKRNVEVEGRVVEMLTWCIRVCDCTEEVTTTSSGSGSGHGGGGGHKKTTEPTAAPTAAPTTAPTADAEKHEADREKKTEEEHASDRTKSSTTSTTSTSTAEENSADRAKSSSSTSSTSEDRKKEGTSTPTTSYVSGDTDVFG